ncbi:polyhydroxybutyrate depolymerase [Caballeronia calidae]|uniref:Polyhydroxybutyrate depolymerase n=2 Tax=Caballeronia calidae TaxID=1777139 RepID=A0A158E293_9BURK|nr:polyhydroxybutyrate depolymerase [Caballeronia calidae]
MTKALVLRLASAVAAAIGLAACGGSGNSAGSDGGLGTSAKASAALASPTAKARSHSVKLQRYQIDPAKVFVAGISSGGFAAVQMHVAHSSTFKGAAVYAGGVYWCAAAGGAAAALANCGGLTLPSNQASYNSTLTTSEAYLHAQSFLGTIDPAANLRGQPVYLWSGTQDQVVNPREMADLDSEYRRYGANVHFDNTYPAAHGWESPNGELPCGTLGSPYMVRCSANGAVYDSVQTWLTLFLGPLKPRNDGKLSGTLSSFDQTEFGASPNLSMSPTGSVFVPKACAQGSKCGLVLALHGCLQQASLIGDRWVTEAGINEWADTNKLVVVYPDTIASFAPGPINPNACFDWWGYSNQYDPNYALKSGLQMSVFTRWCSA